MFFSYEQIEQSVARLGKLNPFFGTVFLAFKKVSLPVGETKYIQFSQLINDFLQTYYPYYPPDGKREDRKIYTPFKTSNKSDRWNKYHYAGTLRRIADDTFNDALEHPGGGFWGWKPDYVEALRKKHLREGLIPAFDLAVWLFRSHGWDSKVQASDVIGFFFAEFHISEQERTLFDRSIPFLARPWLQARVVDIHSLTEIIGLPGQSKVEDVTLREPMPQLTLPLFQPAEEEAILRRLKLTGTGPAQQLELEPAPRLNLITGDNGLGKTFLLDCAWWALTGTWAGQYQAYPRFDAAKDFPSITFQISREPQAGKVQIVKYNWERQMWLTNAYRNVLPGLSIYALSDGSFAVWDPASYLLSEQDPRYAGQGSEEFIHLTRSEVWDGAEDSQKGKKKCNGLLYDVSYWQSANKELFDAFSTAINELSPPESAEPLIPGQPTNLPGDTRYIPTLRFSYGEVPILLCSAGIQRIAALAYLLVWAWNRHVITSGFIRKDPQRSVVLLVDEMEAHLHPFWQRVIVPALMNVVQKLASNAQTQMFIATHSPLVLASVESIFDEEQDKLFHLYLENGSVNLDDVPFVKRGRIDRWLISDVFGLTQARSKDAEGAIEEAKELQLMQEPTTEEVKAVSEKLAKTLADDDDFWHRWTYFAEQRGVVL